MREQAIDPFRDPWSHIDNSKNTTMWDQVVAKFGCVKKKMLEKSKKDSKNSSDISVLVRLVYRLDNYSHYRCAIVSYCFWLCGPTITLGARRFWLDN